MAGGASSFAPDPGYGALINKLANPPNPLTTIGQDAEAISAAKEFQAQNALTGIYQQSIDPQTGQVDLGKFNALASQNPAALWKFGESMRSAGAGLGAEGQGTSADVQAKLDQLNVQQAYLAPLYQKAIARTATADDIRTAMKDVPPGIISPTTQANLNQQLSDGADPNNVIIGGFFASEHGRQMMTAAGPNLAAVNQGPTTTFVPTNPLYNRGSGGVPPAVPMGVSPETEGSIVTVHRSDGVDEQMPYPRAQQVLGGQVPGAARGVTYTGIVPPPAATGGAVPPGRINAPAAPAAPAAGGAPAAAAPAPTMPAAPAAPAPGAPQTAPGGARYGETPAPGAVATTEESAAQYREARADQTASVNRVATMQNAQKALSGAKTGALGETVQAVNSVLNSVTPEFVQQNVPGADFEQRATKYDEAQKYFTQMANANAGAIGGAATNDKLAAATVASPNVHVTDLAAKQLLGVLIGQERMKQYMFSQAQSQNVTPQNFADWRAKWMTTHDPRAFLPRTQSTLDYLNKNVHGNDRTILNNTITELDKNGQIPLGTPGQD
jgi:hypothetical protein